MENKEKKSKVPIIALVSLVALLVAIKSCSISKNIFTIAYRPWLIVDTVKFKNGDYLKIEENPDNMINVSWKYKVKNVGNSPAKDVALFQNIIFGDKEIPRDKINDLDPITVGPGQSFYFPCTFSVGEKKGKNIRTLIEAIESNKGGVLVKIGFYYENPSITRKKYKTIITHKIAKDVANIQAPTTMD